MTEKLRLEMSSTERGSEPQTILTLPTEIQCQILSELPAREIARSRAVCRHFRDVIDEPSNEILIAGPIIARGTARLQAQVDHALNWTGLNFLQALQHFLSLRGLWTDYEQRGKLLVEFVSIYLHEKHLNLSQFEIDEYEDYLLALAGALIYVHVALHCGEERFELDDLDDFNGRFTFDAILAHVGQEEPQDGGTIVLGENPRQKLNEFYETLIREPDFFSKAIDLAKEFEKPKWPVTERREWEGEEESDSDDESDTDEDEETDEDSATDEDEDADEESNTDEDSDTDEDSHSDEASDTANESNTDEAEELCDSAEFSRVFPAVPLLPAWQDAFCWCVRSRWAHGQVRKAVEDNEIPSPLAKIAVVEDVYLF